MPTSAAGQLNRKTRIIATLGPSTSSLEMITKLLQAGVNIVRLNMSHGTHDDHRKSFQMVRKLAKKLNLPVAIFCDLCGPKIRVGVLERIAAEGKIPRGWGT